VEFSQKVGGSREDRYDGGTECQICGKERARQKDSRNSLAGVGAETGLRCNVKARENGPGKRDGGKKPVLGTQAGDIAGATNGSAV